MPSNQEWEKRWEVGDTPWNHRHADEGLSRLFEELTARWPHIAQGNVFVPLCGDSRSIRFFYDKGCSVFGIELSDIALKKLMTTQFSEANFETTTSEIGVRYENDRITLVQADIFEYSFSECFDLIYDRGALVAIEKKDRPAYAKTLLSTLSNQGVLFLVAFEYEEGEEIRVPFSIPASEVRDLFSSHTIKEVHREAYANPPTHAKQNALRPPEVVLYVIGKVL